jgi:hypothetical protein
MSAYGRTLAYRERPMGEPMLPYLLAVRAAKAVVDAQALGREAVALWRDGQRHTDYAFVDSDGKMHPLTVAQLAGITTNPPLPGSAA